MAQRWKIFGVGMNKTGTTSLSNAVELLGFPALHFGGHQLSADIERAVAEGKPMFRYCDRRVGRMVAFFDIAAVQQHFDEADRQFPGSKFILHTRPLEEWLDSAERHVRRNQRLAAQGQYPEGPWLEVDRDGWAAMRQAQHDRVRRYFARRPGDLLEIDVGAGEGWEKLAPFLGRPVPDAPFPHLNIDAHGPTLDSGGHI